MIFDIFKKSPNDIYEKKLKSFFKVFNQFEWEDKEKVKALIQDAVIFLTPKFQTIKIGASKLGGTPDLPSTIIWPKYKDKSMLFFGQLNLNDISEFHRNELLPKNGILYFFAYFPAPKGQFGAEYDFIKNKKEYTVIYFDGLTSELKQTNFPPDIIKVYQFPTEKMVFETIFQLPVTLETAVIENSTISENDKDQIQIQNDNIIENYGGTFERILGYPVPAQYGVDYDWALSYLNINLENNESEERKSEIENIQPEFVNLLSIPLFSPIGDSQAYFGILKKDLKNKDFTKVVFILQGI